ncbi:Jerky protein homolog-like, partial [Habropoda laboriosa]
ILLVLDNTPAHPSTSELLEIERENVEILFLPPNVTSLIQPMDQSVIETFKRNYRKILLRRLLFADDNDMGFLLYRKISLEDCIYMC